MVTIPSVNKVVYGGNTLIDLTSDTVSAGAMLSGTTAHDRSGASVTGNIPTRTESDITEGSGVVTAPAGFYPSGLSISVGTDDYDDLTNKPIHFDTTAGWNSQLTFVGTEGHIYVYTDYKTINNTSVPGIKISDGQAYLIDTPFVQGNSTLLDQHISDAVKHITSAERQAWDNKVRCYMSSTDTECLIFTTT